MDYEKKYNDALNLAKSYYGNGCNEFLDTIFPELSESEDERVRKWIYNLIGCLGDPQDEDAEKELDEMQPLALAYLEKQKESFHIEKTCKENDDSFTDEDERIRKWLVDYFKAVERCCIHWDISPERIVSYLEKQKEQKPPIAGNDFGWIDELKHDLEHTEELDQKVDDVLKQRKGIRALEWSEEDRNMLNSVLLYFNAPFHDMNDVEKNMFTWLQSLPERFNLQPKQEWSEEDEEIFNLTITHLLSYAYPNNPIYRKEAEKCVAWLKFIRPRPGACRTVLWSPPVQENT